MQKIDIRIMAHPKRAEMAHTLCEHLQRPDDIIVWDDRGLGSGDAMYTAKKAWKAIDKTCTHGIVIQDDVEVVNNFIDYASKCAKAFPKAIFSFYCGRTKMDMLRADTPYVKLKGGHCVAGVAVMMPLHYIDKCFDWIETNLGDDYKHDDAGISMFAEYNGIDIITTIPSLVQHLCPTKSIVGLNNYQKVSKVYVGEDITNVNFLTNEFQMMNMHAPWNRNDAEPGSKAETFILEHRRSNN